MNVGGQTELRSVGRTINYGWDLALELELVGAMAAAQGDPADAERAHRVSLSAGLTLLEAGIHGRTGRKDPAVRAGTGGLGRGSCTAGRTGSRRRSSGTHLSDHFATDDENPTRRIPAYLTWDLTAEAAVWRDRVTVVVGSTTCSMRITTRGFAVMESIRRTGGISTPAFRWASRAGWVPPDKPATS